MSVSTDPTYIDRGAVRAFLREQGFAPERVDLLHSGNFTAMRATLRFSVRGEAGGMRTVAPGELMLDVVHINIRGRNEVVPDAVQP